MERRQPRLTVAGQQPGGCLGAGHDVTVAGVHPQVAQVLTHDRVVLRENEVYLAHEGVWHGDSVFIGDDEYDECWILDVFAPPRDDLRAEG